MWCLWHLVFDSSGTGHPLSRETIGEAVDEVAALFECLAGEGSKEVGNLLELADEALFVVVSHHFDELLLVDKEVDEELAAFFVGKDDVGIEFSVLCEDPAGHHEFGAVDWAGVVEDFARQEVVFPHEGAV